MGQHLVATGPITGSVILLDGTKVDVTPEVVAVDSPAAAQEVAHLIGARYETEGHPQFTGGAVFVHEDPVTFELHPDMAEMLEAARVADPELADRVAKERERRGAGQ